jgi:hypothetical protein
MSLPVRQFLSVIRLNRGKLVGFSFVPCQAALAADAAFQADAFQAPSVASVEISRPTAVRTFFEGREGYWPYRKLRVCPQV